jgi:hypothetical protein
MAPKHDRRTHEDGCDKPSKSKDETYHPPPADQGHDEPDNTEGMEERDSPQASYFPKFDPTR